MLSLQEYQKGVRQEAAKLLSVYKVSLVPFLSLSHSSADRTCPFLRPSLDDGFFVDFTFTSSTIY